MAGVNYKGRGVRFKVTDSAGLATSYNADTGTGCKVLSLKRFETYSVRVYSKETFADGNTVNVMNDDVAFLNYGWTATASLNPGALSTTTIPPDVPSVTYLWSTSPGGNYTDNISTVMSALVKNSSITP